MIVLKADTNNSIYVSLVCNLNISLPSTNIFFKLVNDMTKEPSYFYPNSTTIFARHALFSIIEPATVNLNKEYGFYTYTIYETTNSGLTDDSSLSAADIVHQGKLHFSKTGVSEVTYTEYTNTNSVNTTNKNTQYISI